MHQSRMTTDLFTELLRRHSDYGGRDGRRMAPTLLLLKSRSAPRSPGHYGSVRSEWALVGFGMSPATGVGGYD